MKQQSVNKISEPIKKQINPPKTETIPKNMINLENVILLEEKLRKINENILKMSDLSSFCEDWWEISHSETMLQNLGNVFKEPRYKAILKTATAVEMCAVSYIYAISQHFQTPPKSIIMSKICKL